MAPFDGSVIRYKSLAANELFKFSMGVVDLNHITRYLKLFDFDLPRDVTNIEEILLWAALLPNFHNWAGNPNLVEKVLSLLFGFDFKIIENVKGSFDIPKKLRTRLGRDYSVIEKSFVLGKSFSECDSTYEVQIRKISPAEADKLLPGSVKRQKLEWVLNTCMPNNLEYRIRIFVNRTRMKLGDNESRNRLGYSTYA